eukprot:m.31872 g.31872  ORF g.31872 m.31872 type:complete len:654 (-) comp9868_c0_seq1:76-2037(-)
MFGFETFLSVRAAHLPVLSPNGERVAFITDITGVPQVWSVACCAPSTTSATSPSSTWWPQQLTFFQDKVWSLHGTAAADHLVAVSDCQGNEKQQLFLVSNYGGDAAAGHTVTRLTHNDKAIHRFGAFSSDGQRVLLASNARNGTDFDAYIIDLRDPSAGATLLFTMSGNMSLAAWSPDGGSVLAALGVGPLESHLHVHTLTDLTAPPKDITDSNPAATPARFFSLRWTDAGLFALTDRVHDRGALVRINAASGEQEVLLRVDQLPEDDRVAGLPSRGVLVSFVTDTTGTHGALVASVDGFCSLWYVDLRSMAATLAPDLPPGVITNVRFGGAATAATTATATAPPPLVFAFQSATVHQNVWGWRPMSKAPPTQLTYVDRAGVPLGLCVEPRSVTFPSFDGVGLQALVFVPEAPPRDPAAGYPAVLYVHGGPTSQIQPDFDPRFQCLLQQGFAVVAPNVRGSSGFGRKYMALDEVERRKDSVADLEYVVRWMHEQTRDGSAPLFDRNHIAIYGRSYGGFMVLAAIVSEFAHHFCCAVDVVGISDWVTFLERTGSWRRAHREREYGSLEHDRDVLREISPIHKAHTIKCPLLVIAGDNDPRVPLFESQQIVDKVRAAGCEVEFLHYADEGHKIAKLHNRIHCFNEIGRFFQRFLQ